MSDDLKKTHPVPPLPKLGIEDRRETPTINESEVPLKQKLLANQHVQHKPSLATATPQLRQATVKDSLAQIKGAPNAPITQGITGSAGPIKTSYALNDEGQTEQPNSTKLHEDTHMLFNRVSQKYGKSGALRLATNLYNAIPETNRKVLRAFGESRAKQRYANDWQAATGSTKMATHMDTGAPHGLEPVANSFHPKLWHEEHLSYLQTYLNNPEVRQSFHARIPGHTSPVTGQLTSKGQAFHSKMKQAYRHVQQAARKADKGWTERINAPTRNAQLHKSQDWTPTESDTAAAADMLHMFHDGLPEFAAAKFLANQYAPTQEEIEAALNEHEGNYADAALMAHGLEVNPQNLSLLKKIMDMQEVSKSEFQAAIMPRLVEPFNTEAIPVADLIRETFTNNEVRPVELGGKHSEGTALLKNPEDGTLWLLKPGSGNPSPSLGVREETASQSRREVAFNQIAGLMGLGHYVPRSALVVLDGKEVAALEFFSNDFKPLERVRKDQDRKLAEIFSRFVPNGLIYKWAAMDYLLGQPDRHAGNIMVDDGDNVRFIDAGSAFAGPSFSPATDPKSFVPFYLRVFTPRKFKTLTPEERFKVMPQIPANADEALKYWVDSINEGQIVAILNQFQINPQPVVNRLKALRDFPRPKSEFLRMFYSGLAHNLMVGGV